MVDKTEIEAAAERITPFIHRTPTLYQNLPSIDMPIAFKLELLQKSGSFKARGAFNNVLAQKVPDAGVIAASGGNHGAAVAYAAQQLGHRAEVYLPTISSPVKVARLKSYDAEVIQTGGEFAETYPASLKRQEATGALSIHPFDNPLTLAGQGTLARELESQTNNAIDTVFVAVGGGGLVGGVLSWFQGQTKVIAVEPENAATLHQALEKGKPVPVSVSGLASDSLGARQIGQLGFNAAQKHLHQNLLVSDNDISAAQLYLWDTFRVTAEPGGATALAPLLSGQYSPARDERIAVVICGGNVELSTLINQ